MFHAQIGNSTRGRKVGGASARCHDSPLMLVTAALRGILADFNVPCTVMALPRDRNVVYAYVAPAVGARAGRIIALATDIQRELGAQSVIVETGPHSGAIELRIEL